MKKYLVALSFCLMAIIPVYVFAVGGSTGVSQPIKIDNPFNCGQEHCNLIDLFKTIVDKALLPIGGALAVLAFIWSGFMFVTAQGKPTEIETAKRALTYTAIGTAILLGAVALTKVITGTINALK
jgi:hypothetical protein